MNDFEDTDSNENATKVNSLEDCTPAVSTSPSKSEPSENPIRRPARDESFTTTAEDPVTLACVIKRHLDQWGNLEQESYHPVTGNLQNQVMTDLRSVAFHPCVSASGATFISPQKLDPPNARANSWNASLAQAFSYEPGQWRTLQSDRDAQCYQHELIPAPFTGIPEYRDFRSDLERTLSPNIISCLDDLAIKQDPNEPGATTDIEEI